MKLGTVTLLASIVLATPALAKTPISCTRDAVFAGGGAFNFTCKEDAVAPGDNTSYPFGRQNYCIAYLFRNPSPPPAGSDAINGWVQVVNTHTALTFTDNGETPTTICAIVGSHLVQGVGATN